MSKSQKDLNIVTHTTELNPKLLTDVRKSIVVIRDIPVIACLLYTSDAADD